MIQSVTVVNHESKTFEFLLNDVHESGLYISNIEGLGYPSSSISSSETFNSSISVYGKTTKQPRNIVITFGISNWGSNSVEQARHLIYNMFTSDIELYMEFKSDERLYNITGYVENITPIIFSSEESVQVSIICPNPYFYSGGKIEVTSDDHLNRFQFTKWFEQLTHYRHLTQTIYVNMDQQVSELYSKSEFARWIECYSRFENPTGFEIKINRQDSQSFNKIVIEHSGGTITIGKNDIPISEVEESENAFVGKHILLVNNQDDQNIYEVDEEGNKTSILEKVIIDGDFINLKTGYNVIAAKMFGIFEKEQVERLVRTTTSGPYVINGYNYNAWTVYINHNFYMDEIDMFFNNTGEYLGTLSVTSYDLSALIDSSYTPDPDVNEEGESVNINAYYKCAKSGIGDDRFNRRYGIYVTRSEKPTNNKNEYEENGYFYTIWLKMASIYGDGIQNVDFKKDLPDGRITTLDVVSLKNKNRSDLLYQMYVNLEGREYEKQIKIYHSFFDLLDNPLNKKTYISTYDNIDDFKITAKYDEMFDAF